MPAPRPHGPLRICPPESIDDYHRCVEIQARVWGFPPEDVVPVNQLVAAHHAGGVVLLAWVQEAAAGFVYGFPGLLEGRPYHHSHMLAVLPQFRRRGIGRALKLAQRQEVLAQGLDLVGWTFDPLEGQNAHLNLARLGGVVRRYRRNVYGETPSPLHGGLPTDRFFLEWEVASERVRRRLSGEDRPPGWEEIAQLPAVLEVEEGGGPRLHPPEGEAPDALRLEIPLGGVRGLVERDPGLARAWRLAVREAAEALFARGYAVVEIAPGPERWGYLFVREGGR